jgi:K+-sensing histidine kinase KdpD
MMKIVKKVLIITNKSGDSFAFDDISNNCSAEIILVNSIDEALNATAEHDFAAAVTDTQLSADECCKILKLIRQSERTKSLPVIFLTDNEPGENYPAADSDPVMVDYLIKPVKLCILASKIKTYICLYENKKRLEYEKEKCQLFKEALKQLEIKSRTLKTKSEESDKLISSFFANLSHEIRTPMNAIIGFTNLLADDTLPVKDKLEYISYINRSSIELLNLIDNIIDISRIEASQLKIKKEPVPVRDILMELYLTFKAEINKKEPGLIELVYANINDKEDIIIKNDECRLRKVMQNLLNNALKFTCSGLIEFGYKFNEENKILFYVKDTGMGIPEDKLQKIFSRFERVDNEYYTNIPGTGLGLYIVKKMVELMEGKIWVESELNIGSVFYFELHYDKADSDDLKSLKEQGVHPIKEYK